MGVPKYFNADGISTIISLRFAGQYYDAESGLHYNYFRYYDAATGRYITSDPIGLLGGINTYAYVNNNPINLKDVLGLAAEELPGLCTGAGCYNPPPSSGDVIPFPPGGKGGQGDRDKDKDKGKDKGGSCPYPDDKGKGDCTFTGLAGVVPSANGYGFYLQCQYRCPRKGLRIDTRYLGIKSNNPAFLCPRTLPESFFP